MRARIHRGIAGASICAATTLLRPQQVQADGVRVGCSAEPERLSFEGGIAAGNLPSAAPVAAVLGARYEHSLCGTRDAAFSLVGPVVADLSSSVNVQLTRADEIPVTRLELRAPSGGLGVGLVDSNESVRLLVGAVPKLSWAPQLDVVAIDHAAFSADLGARGSDAGFRASLDVAAGYAVIKDTEKSSFNGGFGLDLFFDAPFGGVRLGSVGRTVAQFNDNKYRVFTTADTSLRFDFDTKADLSFAVWHSFMNLWSVGFSSTSVHMGGVSLMYTPYRKAGRYHDE